MLLWITVACEDDFEPVALTPATGLDDRQKRLAHRTGRGDKQQQRAFAVGARGPELEAPAIEVDDLEQRRSLADREPSVEHQRARRSDALVEHAELPRQCQDNNQQR